MRIHFAILTYNALSYTQRCLESVLAHTTLPFDVQIVDNASSDGTQAWLAGISNPRIRVHESAENLGVPGGRNELLRQILPRATDEDFVVFLDNDIVLHEGWHQPYERLFESHPRAGMASKVGYAMQVRGDTRDPQALPWETGRVDIVAGGFACWVRVEAVRAVGPLDENLGLFWHEDDDWAVRFTAHGWSIWSVPEAPMTHHEHASGVAWPSLANGDSQRNLAYLTGKWRELGYLDEQGWIRDRDALFCPSLEARAEIQTRLHRLEPISRGEYVEAWWDLHALLATTQQGRIFPRPVSPCLTVLLELLSEGRGFDVPSETRSLYESLSNQLAEIQCRRDLARVEPVERTTSNPPVHGIARNDSWENAAWLAAYHEVKGPGSSADWYGRSSTDWVDTSLFLSLRERGVLGLGKRGLILDPQDVSLANAISKQGCDLVLCGHFDRVSEAGGGLPPEFLTHPERWMVEAGGDWRVCRRSELNLEAPFDFVVTQSGLVCDPQDPALQEVLGDAARLLAPGGQVALILECLLGQDGRMAFTPEDSSQGLGLASGFQCITDASTLASMAAPIARGRQPGLCRLRGSVIQTHALLLYEKQAVPPLPRPGRSAEVSTRILIDTRGMDWEQGMGDATREGLAQVALAIQDTSHPSVTILGDGDCHPVLQSLLSEAGVCYRDSHGESMPSPDLVQYLEGPRQFMPRRLSIGSGRPVLALQSCLTRGRFGQGLDPWNETAYLQFLQREASLIVIPGSDRSLWDPESLDLDPARLRFVGESKRTLQRSAVSLQEAKSLLGLEGSFLLLEGSLGARDRFAEILRLLQEELSNGQQSVLAFGREFQGFERLKGPDSHPVLQRMRFATHLPEALRRPLFEGAGSLIDASREGEFRLGSSEAAAVGLSCRRVSGDRLVEVVTRDHDLSVPADAGSNANLGLSGVWREVLADRAIGTKSSFRQEHLRV